MVYNCIMLIYRRNMEEPKPRIKLIEEMVLRYRRLPMKPLICLCKIGFKEMGIIDIRD